MSRHGAQADINRNAKYQLGKDAKKVRLDVFSLTGYHLYSRDDLPAGFGWNEYFLPIKKFGSAIYRCRLEVDFGDSKDFKIWKMAVVR